ncbi:hypothetical protein INR49_006525, partial [Caranx melampygus]
PAESTQESSVRLELCLAPSGPLTGTLRVLLRNEVPLWTVNTTQTGGGRCTIKKRWKAVREQEREREQRGSKPRVLILTKPR